jgi:hypothetical protein
VDPGTGGQTTKNNKTTSQYMLRLAFVDYITPAFVGNSGRYAEGQGKCWTGSTRNEDTLAALGNCNALESFVFAMNGENEAEPTRGCWIETPTQLEIYLYLRPLRSMPVLPGKAVYMLRIRSLPRHPPALL